MYEGRENKVTIAKKVADLPKWKPWPQVLSMPPMPLPMHGLAPRVVLGGKWWDAVRFAAYRSTNFHCISCSTRRGSTDWCRWLEGHEVYDIDYLMGRMTYQRTVPLCQRCHKFIHSGYARVMMEEGIITFDEWNAIQDHGQRVLTKYKLSKAREQCGPSADWCDWRLVIGEQEYPPLFASFDEYREAYGKKHNSA